MTAPRNASVLTSKGASSDINISDRNLWVHLDETRMLGAQMHPQTSHAHSASSTRLYFCAFALVLSGGLLLENNFFVTMTVSWQSTSMPWICLLFRAVCAFFSVFPSTWAADSDNLRCGFNARSDSVKFPLEITKKCSLTNKKTRLSHRMLSYPVKAAL